MRSLDPKNQWAVLCSLNLLGVETAAPGADHRPDVLSGHLPQVHNPISISTDPSSELLTDPQRFAVG